VIDLFPAAVDQCGILEMKPCFEQTGGFYIMTDSFGNPVFKESFKKFFEVDDAGELKMGFVAEISVIASKEVKVSGAIGQVTSLKQKNAYVSDNEVGVGQTNKWFIGGLDHNKSIAFYFDVVNTAVLQNYHKIHVQFRTQYRHSNGSQRLRVTTVQRLMTNPDNLEEMAHGFDQEAAAVLLSRYAIFKTFSEDPMDVIRWLDRVLIKLVAKFAQYKKDDTKSFKLSREFSLFPQFMFYLRRSPFLQTFNASPDESMYYNSLVMRENVNNSLVMIQPALMSYDLDSEQPTPVLLDIASMKQNVVLLLDTFFYVAIWKGDTIVKWEDAGYADDPSFENFKGLLEAPIEDARFIMSERFPMPRFYVTKPNDTNERKIKVKVNPGQMNTNNQMVQDGSYFTEDVSLSLFMQHLVRMAVQS
jgi:protein transport protein SEC23